MEVAFWLLLSLGIAIFFWLCWRNIQRSRHERLNKVLTLVLTIAALMAGHGTTWATEKTVTYTFTAVDGSGDAKTLTFTPSGNQFGTNPGAKTVTIPSTSNTTGFTVELDDGVILTFSRNPGYMTFSSSGEIIDGIMLNYSVNNNSRFTVACTDYYIRHVKFADKNGYAFYGIGTPAPTSKALLDVDVNIDKASSKDDHSNCYQVKSVDGTPTFGSITITLADFASGSGSKEAPYTIHYTSDLDHLATFVNNGQDYSGVYFVLSNDIAYSYSKDWNFSDDENNYTAIGTYEHPFKGTFDGQGYTVSGIRIYKKYTTSNKTYMDQGLFGYVGEGGTVKRVNLADTRITAYTSGGGIAGRAYHSTIEDCSVGNDVWIHAVENGADDQGGIVGCSQSGTVRRCISRATLAINSGLTSCNSFGGIVGDNNNIIEDCIATGVIIPNVNARGAIAGYNYEDNNLTRNYYRGCKVASNSVTPSGVGVGTYNSTATSDVSNNQGAFPIYAITLSDNVTDELKAQDGKVTDVTLTRTFPTGKKQTVCLPFNPSALLSIGKVWAFTGISGDNAVMTEQTGSLTANTPYIFEATSEVTSTAFNIVTINIGSNPNTDNGELVFYGTYEQKTWEADAAAAANIYGFMLADNDGQQAGQFVKARRKTILRPFSCWLEKTTVGALSGTQSSTRMTRGSDSEPEVIGIIWRSATGETTGIGSLNLRTGEILDGSDEWFSIDGRRLSGKPSKRGLYINKGKKVVIK